MMITNKTKAKNQHQHHHGNDGIKQYKGLFYNDTKGKEYYEYGAHFDYKELCEKLTKVKEENERKMSCMLQNRMISHVINTHAIKKIISAATLTSKNNDKDKGKTNRSPLTIKEKLKSDLGFSRNNKKIIKGSSFNVITNNNLHFTHLNVNVNVNVIQSSSSSQGKATQKNVINDYNSTITNNINSTIPKKNSFSNSQRQQYYKNKPRLNIAIQRSLNDTIKQFKSKDFFTTLSNKHIITSTCMTHKPSQSQSNTNLSNSQIHQCRGSSCNTSKKNIIHLTEVCLSPMYNHKKKHKQEENKVHYRNLTLYNSIQKAYQNNNSNKSYNNTRFTKLK